MLAIKNSKKNLPAGVVSAKTSVYLAGQKIGCINVRYTRTLTRWSSVNKWTLASFDPCYDIFGGTPKDLLVEEIDEAVAVTRYPTIPIGRRNGRTMGFALYRVTTPGYTLPNGFYIGPESKQVLQNEISFGSEAILSIAYFKSLVRDVLPFSLPGGPGSLRETITNDQAIDMAIMDMASEALGRGRIEPTQEILAGEATVQSMLDLLDETGVYKGKTREQFLLDWGPSNEQEEGIDDGFIEVEP